jgi:hypothetical protein
MAENFRRAEVLRMILYFGYTNYRPVDYARLGAVDWKDRRQIWRSQVVHLLLYRALRVLDTRKINNLRQF